MSALPAWDEAWNKRDRLIEIPPPFTRPAVVDAAALLRRILIGLAARTVDEPPGGWLLIENKSIRLPEDELALVRELIGDQ